MEAMLMKKRNLWKWMIRLTCIACMVFSIFAVYAEEETETPPEGSASEKEADSSAEEKTAEEAASLQEEMPQAVKEYDLWVSGVRVTELNQADILGDQTASYEEREEYDLPVRILTLRNADLEVKDLSGECGEAISAAICTRDDLTIRLESDSEIHASFDLPDDQKIAGIALFHSAGGKSVRIEGGKTLSVSLSVPGGSNAAGILLSEGKNAMNNVTVYKSNLSITLTSEDSAAILRGIDGDETYVTEGSVTVDCENASELACIRTVYANLNDSSITLTCQEGAKGYGIYNRSRSMFQSGTHVIGSSDVTMDTAFCEDGIGGYGENGAELLLFDTSALEISASSAALHYDEIHDKDGRGVLLRKTLSDKEVPEIFEEGEMTEKVSDQYRYVCMPKDKRRYTLVSADKTWRKESGKPARFTWKNTEEDQNTYARFAVLMFDETELEESCYFKEEGSLKIELLPAFLETITAGEHIVQAVFSDGLSETAQFTVEEKKPEPTSSPSEGSSSSISDSENRSGSVITCQMAGYPQGYAWNESAKACEMGTLDDMGVFHPSSADGRNKAESVRKYASVNTGDKGVRGSLITLITALLAALLSGTILKKYS